MAMKNVQAHESAAASAAELSGRAETSAIRRVEGAVRRGQQERDDYIDHNPTAAARGATCERPCLSGEWPCQKGRRAGAASA